MIIPVDSQTASSALEWDTELGLHRVSISAQLDTCCVLSQHCIVSTNGDLSVHC